MSEVHLTLVTIDKRMSIGRQIGASRYLTLLSLGTHSEPSACSRGSSITPHALGASRAVMCP